MQGSAGLSAPEPFQVVMTPESPRNGEGVFTGYVRILDSEGEPPPEAFDELWLALRSAVITELRRRSAWRSPPSYYGVYGWASWQARDPGPGRTGSALEELLTDCYAFVFLEQRPRLRAQLAVKPNVDGLVVLYLRNYLHERRRRHDLLGYRVFETLRTAVGQALEAGELWGPDSGSRLGNASVVTTSPEADPADAAGAEVLRPIVERWTDDLLPDLVTAGGARRRLVVERLRRHLLRLEAHDVAGFRFKDLADTLKHDVRARWAAIFDLEEGEPAIEDADARGFTALARLVRPEESAEARDSFDKLVACVANRVEGLAGPETTRHYLRHLWGFLRAWASGEGPEARSSESLPSGRRLGELLHIPRKRFPRLWETLRDLVRQCQGALARPRYERGAAGEVP